MYGNIERAEMLNLRARTAALERIVLAMLGSTLDREPLISTLTGELSAFEDTFDDRLPIESERQGERAALRLATQQHLSLLIENLEE
jgi:hypothetical protein